MEDKYCQSCGMPMGDTDAMYGMEKDGKKSQDYCKYCFENGAFTFEGSMDEMIEVCVPHVVEANKEMTAEAARNQMKNYFPMLKRWRKA